MLNRIRIHVKKEEGYICVAQRLYEQYIELHGHDVTLNTFKRVISNVLDVTVSYQTINNTRVSVYKGLHFVPKPNVERPASTQTPAIPDGWNQLQHPTDDFYGLRTDYKSNGHAIWKEVRVDTHGNVSVIVGGREVDPGHIGMPCHISNIMPLGDCLNIVATSRICVGKEVDETHRNGVLHAVGDSQTIRIQSRSCHVLMSVLSRGSICRRCDKQVISMREEAVDGELWKTEEQEDSEVHHIDENETEE